MEETGEFSGCRQTSDVACCGCLFWQWIWPTCTYNYRLEIDVAAPSGWKSGKTIIRRTAWTERFVPGFGARGFSKVAGEAVYVDLGAGKNLFVTLTDQAAGRHDAESVIGAQSAEELPWTIFTNGFDLYDRKAECAAAKALNNQQRDVPLVNLPTTVTFRDLKDPKSVELVDPRDISLTFGPGYAIKSAKISTTRDELPPPALATVLKWLPDLRNRGAFLNDRGVTDYQKEWNDVSARLSAGDFSRGFE